MRPPQTPDPPEADSAEASSSHTQGQVRVILTVVFLVFVGNTAVNPILAPLSREVGLVEWQIGMTISTAALMLVLTSGVWGRRSQSWGRRPVILAALVMACSALSLFALAAYLGMRGLVTGGGLFAFFLAFRGVLFGSAMAAVPATAQAFIADITTSERERVRGMAGIGAAQGMAMITGAILGGGLAAFGLMTPLLVLPVLLAAAFALVLLRLDRQPATSLVANPVRVRPTDSRAWPYLLAGFGLFTALGFVQIVTGFLVQDRLNLEAERAGVLTGVALVAAGVGIVLAQSVIVPRSGWPPHTLLRVGGSIATVGLLIYIPDLGFAGILVAILMLGLGLGIAMPGYVAGPTLHMRREEFGAMAGLISANNGLTFVIAPTAGSALYGVWPQLPIIVGATVMAMVTLFVLLHPRFRREPDVAAAEISETTGPADQPPQP